MLLMVTRLIFLSKVVALAEATMMYSALSVYSLKMSSKGRTVSNKVLTRTMNLGLGLLECSSLETSNWARQLKMTGSPTED